jgi:lysophospholipase L1-like esterase
MVQPANKRLVTEASLPEVVHNALQGMLVSGVGINITYDGDLNTVTITATGAGGLDLEQIQDAVAAMIVEGSGLSAAYDDALGTYTITNTVSDTNTTDPEVVRDTMAAALTAGAGITIAHDDTANTITITATGGGGGLDLEQVQDAVAAMIVEGSGLSAVYDDEAGTYTITLAAHTHNASEVTGLAPVATSGDKADVGLDQVQNTSDTNKPVSTAQAAADALRILDPTRYNASKNRAWKAALGNRATAPVNAMFVGDSLTEGQGAATGTRFVDRVRDGLRARYQPPGIAGGEGYVPAFYVAPGMVDRWSYTGTVVFREDLGGLGERMATLAVGATATLQFFGTGLDIYYAKGPTAGSFKWAVDGGAETTVNANNATISGGNVEQIRGLEAKAHTLVITGTVTTSYLGGGFVYNGDEALGLRFWEAGHSGWQSDDLANVNAINWMDAIATIQPSLIYVLDGLNDYASGSQTRVSPTDMKANFVTLVAAMRAKYTTNPLPTIIFGIPHERATSGTLLAPWADYRTAYAEFAAADGNVTLHDLGEVIGSFVGGDPYDLDDGDALHWGVRGHRAAADSIIELLSIPGGTERLPAVQNLGVYIRTQAYLTANPTLPNVPNDSIVHIIP